MGIKDKVKLFPGLKIFIFGSQSEQLIKRNI